MDYAHEIGRFSKTGDEVSGLTFAQQLFRGGEKHLNATVSMLNQTIPNGKALEDARMAVEVFLKAYLATKAGLTEKQAKDDIRHNINEALQRCISAGLNELSTVSSRLSIFPEINARYSGSERPLGELWSAYRIAQFVAASVIRDLSGRDSRPNLELTCDGQSLI